MVRYLIRRPVAVIMTFMALVIAGCILIWKIPLSLLPEADVPQIVIRVNYANTPAATLEQSILKPIRENLLNLNHIKHIESRATNHIGLAYLYFDYGTRMDLAFIEVNEKLDRLTNTFPADMLRPQVMRINTSDIPIIRIQVTPKDDADFLMVSALTEKILKKRLEQLDGVSLVDVNGRQQGIITLTPDKEQLLALGIDENILAQTIQNANRDIGGLSVRDGQYRYFVRLGNTLASVEEMEKLPVKTKDGTVLPLSRIAAIRYEPEIPTGYHLYNGKEALVITVQKQPGSRMTDLVPAVREAVEQFKKDYSRVNFTLTQDQSFLLDAGISNLYQDIFYGGLLTIALLFLLLGNWASPVLMSISIPVSLIISFIFFYIFNISFNIISLSGLALGVGMLIDNSIVVVDSITRKRRIGNDLEESCVQGTNEVMVPVLSQMLTTVAVYAPLILLSGIGGMLITDQSIALTISLGVSLVVAFVLVPLFCKLFLKMPVEKLQRDTFLYKKISGGYHRMIDHILAHRLIYLIATILMMPVGIILAGKLKVTGLPSIEKKESLVQVDWNEPIDANENLRRTRQLQRFINADCLFTESEVGIQQFLLQADNNTIQKTSIYFSAKTELNKLRADNKVKQWLSRHFSNATLQIMDAPNAFTQLFTNNAPYLEARFRRISDVNNNDHQQLLDAIARHVPSRQFSAGDGLMMEQSVDIMLNDEKMAMYGVSRFAVENKLQQLFGTYTITEIKRFGETKSIRLKAESNNLEEQFTSLVKNNAQVYYPLNTFISMQYAQQPRFITADATGEYKSIVFTDEVNAPQLQQRITNIASRYSYEVDFTGRYFENQMHLRQLWLIFLVVLLLLYIILAIQYENLILPLLVMLTIPLGITGGMLLLWATGGTLNVMAAIGFIVVLGLIVDDPILKIETLNRLKKEYASAGVQRNEATLKQMIHQAGDTCLKPLLMVSLTTSLALVPVLFISGIGNDLQKPLAYVIIGGLTLGTFFTTWFIPLAYWYVNKWIKN